MDTPWREVTLSNGFATFVSTRLLKEDPFAKGIQMVGKQAGSHKIRSTLEMMENVPSIYIPLNSPTTGTV